MHCSYASSSVAMQAAQKVPTTINNIKKPNMRKIEEKIQTSRFVNFVKYLVSLFYGNF